MLYKRYFNTELKRKFKSLPLFFLSCILLCIIVLPLCLFFYRAFYTEENNTSSVRKEVVFVSKDSSKITSSMISSLSDSESITTLFDIYEYDEVQPALDELENDDCIAVVSVPEHFLTGLNNGTNYPVKIYFNNTDSIYSLIIYELSASSEVSLRAAEAALYSQYDFYVDNKLSKYADDANSKLNFSLLTDVFARNKVFNQYYIDSFYSGNIAYEYIASGIILLLLFAGIIFVIRSPYENLSINHKLLSNKIGILLQVLTDMITSFIFYCLVIFITFIVFVICKTINPEINFTVTVDIIPSVIVIIGLISSWNVLSKNISSNKSLNMIFMIFSAIVVAYISGCFIPGFILPGKLYAIGKYTPLYMCKLTLSSLISGAGINTFLHPLTAYIIGMYILSCILLNIRLKKR